MKKLLIIAAFLAASLGAMAQSSAINFSNRDPNATPPLLQPVFNVDGVTALSGTGFFAQLYWSSTAAGTFAIANDAVTGLPADPVNFRTGSLAGIWLGGSNGSGRSVPVAGGNIFLQVKAWDATGGNTYAAALAAGKATGESAVFQYTTVEAPATPGALTNFKSFSLVPEPSTIALGLLGAGALLLRRRK